VLPAIYLNNKLCIQANEIKNVIAKWVLASEFAAIDLAAAQPPPQCPLGIRHIAAK